MTLEFTLEILNKPSNFVQKIWEALLRNDIQFNAVEFLEIVKKSVPKNYVIGTYLPKIHTLRQDKTDRWKAGKDIDFYTVNAETKKMRFAPSVPVIATQNIAIIYIKNFDNLKCLEKDYDHTVTIYIDSKFYGDVLLYQGKIVSASYNIEALTKNDGFDTPEDFFAYFNKTWTGKIIHWTNLKY